MATLLRQTCFRLPAYSGRITPLTRSIGFSSLRFDELKSVEDMQQSWLQRVIRGTKDRSIRGYASVMSDDEFIYEIATHDTRCGEMKAYQKQYEAFATVLMKKVPDVQLVGSWRVLYGSSQDQAVHLWKYKKGYESVDETIAALSSDQDVSRSFEEQLRLCRKRKTMLVKSFSYWGDPQPRNDNHIYDLRSYVLKPGHMIEWGNSWVKGITYRRDCHQDVGGFFSQVGQLYMVFHLWAYKDLSTRKQIREAMWAKPGWDRTVAYTVPLIQRASSKVMKPNSFSLLK